ncbi:phosphotransferase [Fimbriimonas ginsengisoli]|uniref:Aminoglycoside phosphotransferase n=1 Tax=Fimbriimonas ginsengisoli Gsoil 348 TaxID=661478 RepID=A0A068NLJ8_FIMGI|nr:phosphotransferase [Fimbriimonas ginsengisoli]AIE84356.1 aminoglycoside phosphotransferase [Fimbriimonas ginsengisoli Gsoil 348]
MIQQSLAYDPSERPSHLTSFLNAYTDEDLQWLAGRFDIPEPITVEPFPDRGNINLHTYAVHAGGCEYLLQKVNSEVFTMPHRVMTAMLAVIDAQSAALQADGSDPVWEPIRLIRTHSGAPYLDLSDDHGPSVWRMMVRIPGVVSYKSLGEISDRGAQLALAEEIGRGTAIYSDLTSSIDPTAIAGSLPGYRDTALYYRQFHSVMAGNRTLDESWELLPTDPTVRAGTELHFLVALEDEEFLARTTDPDLAPFIELVQEREPFTMGLWTALSDRRIRHTLIHGDTKIENFLFEAGSGRVKALVDLDTIMPFTWLADWGDLQRSMVNVAGEKERDLSKVVVDREVYEAVTRGFLQASKEVTQEEVKMMVFAVQAITLELGLRFLTDYLRGDTYFQLGPNDPADLNKVRGMVQLTLYRRLVEFGPEAEAMLERYR